MSTLGVVLLVILVLLLLGAVPSWPHSSRWGYGPASLIGLLLVLVIILAIAGAFRVTI